MDFSHRPIGELYNRAYAAWRQACLGSAGRLGCSPSGIAVGLAAMVGAGLILGRPHRIEAAIQVALHVVLAVAAVSIIVLVVFLARTLRPAPLTPITDRRSTPRPRPRPAPWPEQVPEHVPGPGEAVELPENNITVVLRPDGVERLEEPERIGEPV